MLCHPVPCIGVRRSSHFPVIKCGCNNGCIMVGGKYYTVCVMGKAGCDTDQSVNCHKPCTGKYSWGWSLLLESQWRAFIPALLKQRELHSVSNTVRWGKSITKNSFPAIFPRIIVFFFEQRLKIVVVHDKIFFCPGCYFMQFFYCFCFVMNTQLCLLYRCLQDAYCFIVCFGGNREGEAE